MAREITGVGESLPNGRVDTQMLYVFPIVPRVLDAAGVEVVPAFDASFIPQPFKAQLTPGILAAIAAGDVGYLATSLAKSAGETDPQFVARVKRDYDALTAHALQQRRDKAVEANGFDRRRFQVNR